MHIYFIFKKSVDNYLQIDRKEFNFLNECMDKSKYDKFKNKE